MTAPLRLGLVGAGRVAERHLEAAAALVDVAVAAVVDADGERARRVAGRHGAGIAATDLEAVLGSAVDAVILTVPTHLHHELGQALLAAGKPVLVEKPLAASHAEAAQLAESAERAGVVCMAGQVLRFMPIFTRARRLVEEGRLGRPMHVVERRLCRREEVLPWWPAERTFLLHHWGSHTVDLLLWMLDTEVERVSCEASSEMPGYGGEDDFALVLALANGAKAGLHHSFSSRHEVHDIVLVGERSTLHWDCYRTFCVDGAPVASSTTAEQLAAAFRAQLEHFAACVRGHETPLSSARDAQPAMQALDAAVRSMKTHTAVALAGELT